MKSFKKFLTESHYDLNEINRNEKLLNQDQYNDLAEHDKSLSKENKQHISYYKDSSFIYNNNLRLNEPIHHYEKEIKNMDEVTNHPLKHDYVGYRGSSYTADKISKMSPGDIYHDKGYTGVSLSREIGKHYATSMNYGESPNIYHFMQIHIPAGTKGHFIDIDKNHPVSSEHEMVLHRGTKFQVMKHEEIPSAYDRNTKFHVTHLKVVGQE